MIESRRLLALAAVLNLTVCVGVVSAQTAIVRNAPPGTTIELVLNATSAGTAKPGDDGLATVSGNLFTDPAKTETDALVFLDICENVRKVIVVERVMTQPPQEAGCVRRDMGGVFLIKRVSTLVVDVGPSSPTLLLRQGPWKPGVERSWDGTPRGLVIFGGAGLSNFRDARDIFCGTVTPCGDGGYGFAYNAGLDYWITPYLGAEASFLKPAEIKVDGGGDTFNFDSSLDAQIYTVSAKVGIPINQVRIYGKFGGTFTQAISKTTQVNKDTSIIIDGVAVPIPGGTQTYEQKNEGWSWLFGGGMEVWATNKFAIYGEFGRAVVKGDPILNVEGGLDDRVTYFMVGGRFKIGF